MGTKYSSVTVSGYNSSPPSDDGSTSASNQVKWSTHKTKIGDPLNTAIAAINSALVTALDASVRQITVSDNILTSDHNKTIEIGSTSTTGVVASLPDAATAAAGYFVTVKNRSAYAQTVGRVTSGDTIDGTAANYSLGPGESAVFKVNASANGYNIDAAIRFDLVPLGSVAGTNTITASGAPKVLGYKTGQSFVFVPANANTGATTLNIDSLGAKNIYSGGAALIGGEIAASVPVQVEYDGTQFNLLTPYIQTGTVATTWTFNGSGGTSGSVTLTYQRIGKWVTLNIPSFSATSGTGSTEAANNTAIPAVIRPTAQQDFALANITNNNTVSGASPGVIRMNAGSGTINIFRDNTQAAFTNSSTCGLRASVTISYYVG